MFVNGVWVGMSDSPETLAELLRDNRREMAVGSSFMLQEIGVSRDIQERELFVATVLNYLTLKNIYISNLRC